MTLQSSEQQAQPEQQQQHADGTGLPSSIFVSDNAEVHDVPISVIRRPIPSVLDEGKVCQFMNDIQDGQKLTPIEVLWVEHPPGSHYYFAVGGCHRWEAHQRLKSDTIPARLIKVPPSALSLYMGASSPWANASTNAAAAQQVPAAGTDDASAAMPQ